MPHWAIFIISQNIPFCLPLKFFHFVFCLLKIFGCLLHKFQYEKAHVSLFSVCQRKDAMATAPRKRGLEALGPGCKPRPATEPREHGAGPQGESLRSGTRCVQVTAAWHRQAARHTRSRPVGCGHRLSRSHRWGVLAPPGRLDLSNRPSKQFTQTKATNYWPCRSCKFQCDHSGNQAPPCASGRLRGPRRVAGRGHTL